MAKRGTTNAFGPDAAGCVKRLRTEAPAAIDADDETIRELEDGRSSSCARRTILAQFWQEQVVAPPAGECATQIKFTARYRALSPANKLRLLEVTQRDEIAADLLVNSFPTMPVALQLELLRLSPYHKTAIGMHLMTIQFPVMSDDMRLRFLEVAPENILVALLEKHVDAMSVREALIASRQLDGRQYARLRQATFDLVWRRRDLCDTDDLIDLAQIVLPAAGRDLVAEIRSRFVSGSGERQRPPPAARVVPGPCPLPSTTPPAPADGAMHFLALLFPRGMAECYRSAATRVRLGHGPLVAMPLVTSGGGGDDDDTVEKRAAFRLDADVDWTAAQYGFLQVVLTRELGDGVAAAVTLSDGVDRTFEVGVVDDDSPMLDVPWPLPGLGTPSTIAIQAHLQEADDDESEDVESGSEDDDDEDDGRASTIADVRSGGESPTRFLTMYKVLQALVSLGCISAADQIKLILAYRKAHIKPLLDVIVAQATAAPSSPTQPDPFVFMRMLRECRGVILDD